MAEQQVAALIDFENVGLNSIQWLFDQVSDIGRIIVKRAYGDWSVASNKRDQLLELGIEPIHLFHSGPSGKNSSDIRLAIDAVDLLYGSPVDTFVIVSSDSDFVPLVSRLRSAGKTVIGAGRKAAVSRTLVLSCDRYYFLEQSEEATSEMPQCQVRSLEGLLSRAVVAAMDEQGRVFGSKLYQTLRRLEPSFDFRSLGYSTFAKYLEAAPEVDVTRPSGPGDVIVELAEPSHVVVDATAGSAEWASRVDAAWSKRATKSGRYIPGPTAAADAAQVLGVAKLSVSCYKTLQKLLEADSQLAANWRREANAIIRR